MSPKKELPETIEERVPRAHTGPRDLKPLSESLIRQVDRKSVKVEKT